ncbi:hypothetical protein CIRG_00328 [Coccidioides immitis RMSCC 2394]|uniref:Uncharacterized protein n=1 Tax=Coccidioides immitis RMSCC 2394 TaxID=404692 RepID=A0A0J6XVI2_COCIT|nr:hypothetical protein CIRG_00328 [Coccidioides immitis RMSCC 2394]
MDDGPDKQDPVQKRAVPGLPVVSVGQGSGWRSANPGLAWLPVDRRPRLLSQG